LLESEVALERVPDQLRDRDAALCGSGARTLEQPRVGA
jgi:hypothetical protein